MAHTPGPWGIGRGADGSPLVMVPVHESEGSGFGVAHINRIPRMSSVQGDMDDNARLIAAAPDLLEALKEVSAAYRALRRREGYGDDDPSDALDMATAALLKAEGR